MSKQGLLAGLTAHSVAKRGQEIGVRMALVAQKRDVITLVMREGATPVIAGTAIGLALALLACYVPSRKSTRIDPAVTLRTE